MLNSLHLLNCSKANAESKSKHFSCDLPPVQAVLSEDEIDTLNLWAEGTSPLIRLQVQLVSTGRARDLGKCIWAEKDRRTVLVLWL